MLEIENLFIIRSPLLQPYDYIKSVTNKENTIDHERALIETGENIINFLSNNNLMEVLLISNFSLYKSILNFNSLNSKSKRNVSKSILNYFARMASRSTPYGLLAGINLGEFKGMSHIDKNMSGMYKNTRPDMTWIFSLIKLFEKKYMHRLILSKNPSLYTINNKIKIPFTSRYGISTKLPNPLEIENNRLLSSILDYVSSCIEVSFESLSNYIKSISNTHEKTIDKLIKHLLEQEILISNLRVTIRCNSPLLLLIEQLNRIYVDKKDINKLVEIQKLMDEYNKLPIGNGYSHIHNIFNKMKSLVDTKEKLMVDSYYPNLKFNADQTLKDEINEFALVLYLFLNKEQTDNLKKYKSKFIEKYGQYKEVPLYQLIDDIQGIGYPQYDINNIKTEKVNKLLAKYLYNALRYGKTELDITNIFKLDEIPKEIYKSIPSSFELNFMICASPHEIKENNYYLTYNPSSSSNQAWKSFNRFKYNIENNKFVKSKYTSKEIIDANVSYLPPAGRSANLLLNINDCAYELAFDIHSSKNKENTIHITDLLIGIQDNRFYLKSKQHEKEVFLHIDNMINGEGVPKIIRFLKEIINDRQGQVPFFSWGEFSSFPFLPGLRYKRIVITPARWQLFKTDIPKNNQTDEWITSFKLWKNEYKVPNNVYLFEGNKRLLVNLKSHASLKIIRNEFSKLKKEESLIFTEITMHEKELKNKLAFETTFQVFNKYQDSLKTTNNLLRAPITNIKYLPGDDWIYFKVFLPTYRADDFIFNHLEKLLSMFEESIQYHYIRFANPDFHLRIRFKVEKNNDFIIMLLNEFNMLLTEGIIKDYSINVFEPEYERFMSFGSFEIIDHIFHRDSELIRVALDNVLNDKISISINDFAILNVIYILNISYTHLSEKVRALKVNQTQFNNHFKDYRDNNKFLRKVCRNYSEFDTLIKNFTNDKIFSLFKSRGIYLVDYVKMLEYKNIEFTEKVSLINSIIHLSLNRLGINKEMEIMIISSSLYILKTIPYISSNKDMR